MKTALANPVSVYSSEGEGSYSPDAPGAIPTIEWEHREIHAGQTWSTWLYNAALGNNASLEILLSVKGREAHLVFGGAAGGDATMFLFENVVTTNDGTALPTPNRSRPHPDAPTVDAFSAPTVTTYGNQLAGRFLPGGTGPQAPGAESRSGGEWILNVNTKYVVRLTNISGQNQPANPWAEWYETD